MRFQKFENLRFRKILWIFQKIKKWKKFKKNLKNFFSLQLFPKTVEDLSSMVEEISTRSQLEYWLSLEEPGFARHRLKPLPSSSSPFGRWKSLWVAGDIYRSKHICQVNHLPTGDDWLIVGCWWYIPVKTYMLTHPLRGCDSLGDAVVVYMQP